MTESFQRIYMSDSTSSVVVESKKQLNTYAQAALFSEEQEQFSALSNEFRKV